MLHTLFGTIAMICADNLSCHEPAGFRTCFFYLEEYVASV